MIFLHGYLNLARNACLGISFQSDVTVPTAFVLQVYKCGESLKRLPMFLKGYETSDSAV
jgi:hypothetical protein